MTEIAQPTGIERVFLYGDLAEKFGKVLEIHAETVAKALQIIEANFYGKFFARLRNGEFFVWREDGSGVENAEDAIMTSSCKELHIMPKVEGSGGRGGIMAVLGVVLIGAAFIFSGGLAAGGLQAAWAGMQGTIWGTVAQLGAGLALSGIASMLAPQLDLDTNANEDKKPSYLYSGPVNLEREGGAIPLIYGFPIVGSVVISGGIEIEDIPIDDDDEDDTPAEPTVSNDNIVEWRSSNN